LTPTHKCSLDVKHGNMSMDYHSLSTKDSIIRQDFFLYIFGILFIKISIFQYFAHFNVFDNLRHNGQSMSGKIKYIPM